MKVDDALTFAKLLFGVKVKLALVIVFGFGLMQGDLASLGQELPGATNERMREANLNGLRVKLPEAYVQIVFASGYLINALQKIFGPTTEALPATTLAIFRQTVSR